MDTKAERTSPDRADSSTSRISWKAVMLLTGTALPIVLIGALVAVGRLVPPVVILASIYVVGVVLTSRWGRSGPLLMLLPSAVLIVRHIPLLPSVLANPESIVEFLTTTGTVVLSVSNLTAAVALLRDRPASRASSLTGGATVGLLIALIAVAATAMITST